VRLLIFVVFLIAIVGAFLYANVAQRHAVEALVSQRGANPQATIDLNCDRASHLAKQAWSAQNDPAARYDAATEGLGVINACADPDQRAYGAAMLMAVKTDAEFKLSLGNAVYDARRATALLSDCETRFRETMPDESARCAQNRKALETYLR
jgi:hypothetical protein